MQEENINEERKRNPSVQGRWYESPLNSFFVALCWIWLINNAGKVITTLWMASFINDYDGVLIYNALVGVTMCLILLGIIKGSGKAFVFFIILEIINGCVRTEVERDVVHILVSSLLCGIMSLLLLLKNKKGQTGYNVMFNEENLCRERTDNSKTINVLREDRTCDLIYSEGKEKCVNESSCVDENDTPNSYCRVCGKLIEDDSIYCVHCGNKLN